MEDFPTEINNYREIFLGGGSVLLTVLSKIQKGEINVRGHIYAYDLNEPLIHVYKNIQTKHEELYGLLRSLIDEFNSCRDETDKEKINRKPATLEEAKLTKENYYYWTRIQYNKLSLADQKKPMGSAMFIFLNKTCFRGVFRVGPNGFNVPYGHYNQPEIINKAHLDEIHALIQGVIFSAKDFVDSLADVEDDDFVYLDPPYAPETSLSFVGYTEKGFGIDQHTKLFQLIHQLTAADKKIMMSNADVTLVRENFASDEPSNKYTIASILCKRSINSKNPSAKAKEVIIKNYSLS